MHTISIRGARTHNLKNLNIDLPRDKFIVITGLSGSGKSSLAFDTLYAEGQRRYVESLSAYARQFLSLMEKPDVDSIEGLSPAISIEQKATSHNPRSTVGTVTEIHDYLRLLFARVGEPHCPEHGVPLKAQTVSQMVDTAMAVPKETKLMILAPIIKGRKGEHLGLFEKLKQNGYLRVRINGELHELDDLPALEKNKKNSIDVVVDRIKVKPDLELRLAESFENALLLSEGVALLESMEDESVRFAFSSKYACPQCGFCLQELAPRLFSFNNPFGACKTCDGLGVEQFFDPERVIHNEELSLSGGAIRGWDRSNVYYFSVLSSIANHYDIDVETPYKDLDETIQSIILYGSGKEKIDFQYHRPRGGRIKRRHAFEGVLPTMTRRYRETDSSLVRDELIKYMSMHPCPSCEGARLCKAARHVLIEEKTLPELASYSIESAHDFFSNLHLSGARGEIAEKILKEIIERLGFLINVGLDYLSLSRSADTLSGGEAQRIRLASQIGSGLVGVMYILDEPSIGLHQRDNERLLKTLHRLRDLGNTVIVIEHDEDAILSSDHVVDIGPGAGVHGGEIIAEGTPQDIMNMTSSLTGQYLSGKQKIDIPTQRLSYDTNKLLTLKGVTTNNLNTVDLTLPVGLLTCITGVSGSGKSSLINDTLYPLAAKALNRATSQVPGKYQSIEGLEYFDKVIDIDQSPIGRTPRSNPATYTGLFTPIRDLFATTPEARSRGYKAGRFSFNVKGGRCEACQGDGLIKVEMHFLADVYVKCDVCQAKRYNRETLDIHYKGKTIDDVLKMTVEVAREFFDAVPVLKRKLQTLIDVGLSYITLGQSATTLSGGEAQRIKLARELSKRATGKTLYILDEPTTGLHFHDIKQLLSVLSRLKEGGNTLVIIEHNLDVIKTADWIIDLGPEGGSKGGQIIAEGTPETVAKNKHSYTGFFLKQLLAKAKSLETV
jgi:excinuclease ABC subunit A